MAATASAGVRAGGRRRLRRLADGGSLHAGCAVARPAVCGAIGRAPGAGGCAGSAGQRRERSSLRSPRPPAPRAAPRDARVPWRCVRRAAAADGVRGTRKLKSRAAGLPPRPTLRDHDVERCRGPGARQAEQRGARREREGREAPTSQPARAQCREPALGKAREARAPPACHRASRCRPAAPALAECPRSRVTQAPSFITRQVLSNCSRVQWWYRGAEVRREGSRRGSTARCRRKGSGCGERGRAQEGRGAGCKNAMKRQGYGGIQGCHAGIRAGCG